MNKNALILILLAVVGGLWQNWDKIWPASPASVGVGGHRVVMYATQRCGYCARMRNFFAENGIGYDERDVDSSRSADEDFRKLGGQGVPLIVIDGDSVIYGYQPQAVLRALR